MYKLLASHLERGTTTGGTECVRQVSVFFYQPPFPFKLEASSLYKYTPACQHSLTATHHEVFVVHFAQFNMSHTIHRLSFGHDFPGREDPLDGHAEFVEAGEGLPGEVFVSPK